MEEISTKHRENRVGDDIVQKFGDFSIGDEPEETPQESVFAFLDSPSFQERSESASDNNYGLFQMATNPQDYKILKQYLDLGMYVQETFNEVYPHIFKLMSDVRGAQIFESLLGFCNTDILCAIMVKFVSERKDFFSTALCKSGSKSIQAFALRLVDRGSTGLEGSLTALLAEFACVIMTHTYGWYIFKQCFALFGDGPNQILYGWVIALFDRLAMDPTGVLVINAAVDSVRGYAHRDLLLLVLKNAVELSSHKYGNFVVQHCLSLKHEVVNEKICAALMGRFVELAQKQGGSYVVENCLEFSDFGRKLVLAEILKDARTLEMLARDRLGNYVVQVALEVTRIRDQNVYYKMVKVLQPRCSDVIRNAISKKRRGKCSHYMS